MKAREVTIRNVLGIEDLTFAPGALTVVSGRNGAGKTSVLEALRGALRGGHDPSLIRRGADRGTVEITLEDGTEITKTITPERSTLQVSHPEFVKLSKAQAVVDGLVDSLGVDPLVLLSAPANKRAQYLLDVLPIEVDPEEIRAAAAPAKVHVTGGTAFDQIEGVRKLLFDERTGVNRSLKDKKASAAELRSTIPAGPTEAWDLVDLREELESCEDRRDYEIEQINETAKTTASRISGDAQDRANELKASAETEIEKIRQRLAGELDVVHVAEKRALADEQEQRSSRIAAVHSELDERIADRKAKIAVAEEQSRQCAQNKRTAEIAAKMEAEAADLDGKAGELTAGLDRLAALKERLLEKLPIKGLEVREGQIFLNEIPFDRLNRARQVKLALEVARLRAGKLGLIVVDNLECFDEETFKAFETAARAMDMQVVVGCVTESDLSVRTMEAAAR